MQPHKAMKKAYITPSTLVVETALQSMVCASGDTTVSVTNDTDNTTNGSNALSRHGSLWDDDEEDY